MYLSRLTFQTNPVRHQNITKLKCQDVKLDQLSRCQNEKVRVKIATKKWTNAGEKRGEKTILASKYRAAKAGHISAKGNGGQNLLGRKDTTIAQQNILKFLHPPRPTLLLLFSLSPCSCSSPTTGTMKRRDENFCLDKIFTGVLIWQQFIDAIAHISPVSVVKNS